MSGNKKILFCDNTLWGLLNFRGEIIMHLRNKGYEVVLIAPDKENEQMSLPIPEGVRYIPLDMGRYDTGLKSNIGYFRKLYSIYKAERPDYIFHYTIKPNIYGSIAARMLGLKSTAMIAGLGTVFTHNSFKYDVARQLYKFGLKFSDSIFVLNPDNKDFLINHGICAAKKITLLPGGEGVNLKMFPQYPNDSAKTNFLFVGRILLDKGYQIFVDAAKEVKSRHEDVEFSVLGFVDTSSPEGVPQERIDADVRNGHIKYLGFTHDMASVYKQKGVVLTLPSYYGEGMNRTLMEACASGKPIITSDIPGCKELVRDGVNGFIVEPRSSKSLVAAVEKYLALTAEQRTDFGNASRKHAEDRFDIDIVKTVYDKII